MPGSEFGARNTKIIKTLSLLSIWKEDRFYTVFNVIKTTQWYEHNTMNKTRGIHCGIE